MRISIEDGVANNLPGGAEVINDFMEKYGTLYTLNTVAWLCEFRASCEADHARRAEYQKIASVLRGLDGKYTTLPNGPDGGM